MCYFLCCCNSYPAAVPEISPPFGTLSYSARLTETGRPWIGVNHSSRSAVFPRDGTVFVFQQKPMCTNKIFKVRNVKQTKRKQINHHWARFFTVAPPRSCRLLCSDVWMSAVGSDTSVLFCPSQRSQRSQRSRGEGGAPRVGTLYASLPPPAKES